MAPGGDAVSYYLPNFISGICLWEPLLLSGFPIAADPQAMTWYPLSLIGSTNFDHSWNMFIVLAYVLASFFTYGYVYSIAESRLAGFVGGISFGLSGFMIGHLSHATMIHVAAWMPLVLWSLEELRTCFTKKWFALGALAVCCSVLGGHPQITAYTLGICCLYAITLGAIEGRKSPKYLLMSLLMVLLGLGLAAIQIIPTMELANYSLRSKLSFEEFTSFSLPPIQILSLFFPYLFGGAPSSFYAIKYFGMWNGVWELAVYVGLMPIMLGLIAIGSRHKQQVVWFWALVGCLAFLSALGDVTPIGKLLFKIPVANKFRAPARHFFEWCFAVSVLAAVGIAAIQNQSASRRMVRLGVFSTVLILLLSLAIAAIFAEQIQNMAIINGIDILQVDRLSNPALTIPLMVLLLSALSLLWWCEKSCSKLRSILLVCCLVVDLGSFAWYEDAWRYGSITQNQFASLTYRDQLIKDEPAKTYQRVLPVKGIHSPFWPPNFNRLVEIPSASFYSPLLLSRTAELLNMAYWGEVWGHWYESSNQVLDLLAVRYVALPENNTGEPFSVDEKNYSWLEQDFNLKLGSGCGQPTFKDHFWLPIPSFKATHVGLVSALECSKTIPDGTMMARLVLRGPRDKILHFVDICAGVDTSEWSIDCHDSSDGVSHRRATIFDSFHASQSQKSKCLGHSYVTRLDLKGEIDVNEVEFHWLSGEGVMALKKMTLFNRNTNKSYPVDLVSTFLEMDFRWRHLFTTNKTSIYENLHAKQRVWLVPEVVVLEPSEILRAIHTSKLPGGRVFDASEMALVEQPIDFSARSVAGCQAEIIEDADHSVKLRTSCKDESFLVLSDTFYPGWKATIDGNDTAVLTTNYVLRGVVVPRGTHHVQFLFKPCSFYMGLTISSLTLLVLIVWFFSSSPTSRPTSQLGDGN